MGLSAICAAIPDVDVVSFRFDVAYGSEFSHRGISHSILFAAFVGLLAGWLVWRFLANREYTWVRWSLYFFLITLTHPILDAFTDGGLGVALFAPFDQTRYFFPFRPLKVAPIALSRFFSPRGLQVILSELVWVWMPIVLLVMIGGKFLTRSENE